MYVMNLLLGTLTLCFGLAYSEKCNRTVGLQCCLGYYWNDTLKNCTACKDGFVGVDCSEPCPKTFYGPGCRSKCYCNTITDYCHHVLGCILSSSQASPAGGKICCSGEVWNISLQSCQPCSIGFHGPNCLRKCPFPYYGKNCQLKCLCSELLCRRVDGCNASNEDLSTREGFSHSRSRASTQSSVTESTTARVRHISIKNVGLGQYSDTKRKKFLNKTSGVYTSAKCLIAISGLFLLLYLGLHCYIKRLQRNQLSSATSAI